MPKVYLIYQIFFPFSKINYITHPKFASQNSPIHTDPTTLSNHPHSTECFLIAPALLILPQSLSFPTSSFSILPIPLQEARREAAIDHKSPNCLRFLVPLPLRSHRSIGGSPMLIKAPQRASTMVGVVG